MDQSEVQKFEGQFELQRITKLSEAIRIGARIRPQCRQLLFDDGHSCAVGAWLEGSGHPYIEGMTLSDMPERVSRTFHHADAEYRKAYRVFIWQDNDRGTPREVIATKLEAIGL